MATPEQINAALDKISDQIKAQAEAAEKEIKANAQMSTETRAKVDELLTQQGELQARLASAEQLVAKLENGGMSAHREPSVGEQVIENEDFKAFAAKAARGDKFSMAVKAAITEGAGSGA